LVTTDLTNYFDNIGLRELRHVISAIVKTKEVHLDLLFCLIEGLCWNPDYLPTTHKGLPTINIEAPRLLAHALLFEVDYVLKKRTKDSFVRWMDDINFGVSNLRSAKVILGEISDVLKSRGLALGICCHPYDICTELIAREAGVIVTDERGGRLRTLLQVDPDLSWAGYANDWIRRQIEPLLQAALRERDLID